MIDPERLGLRFRARLAFGEVCCHGALRVVGGDLWRLVHIAEAQKESAGKSPSSCGLRSKGVPCRGDVARSVPDRSGRPSGTPPAALDPRQFEHSSLGGHRSSEDSENIRAKYRVLQYLIIVRKTLLEERGPCFPTLALQPNVTPHLCKRRAGGPHVPGGRTGTGAVTARPP